MYITTTFTLTFAPTDNLEKPINLTFCVSLDRGRKPEYQPERNHADMGRTCRLYTESPGPGNSANHCTTVLPQCKCVPMK